MTISRDVVAIDDFFECVRISENGQTIRAEIYAVTETIFELPHTTDNYLGVMCDVCLIAPVVMRVDVDLTGNDYGPKRADLARINAFRQKYAGQITSIEGVIIK